MNKRTKKQMARYALFLGLAPASAVGLSAMVAGGGTYNREDYAHERNIPLEEVDMNDEYISAKVNRTLSYGIGGILLTWPLASAGLYFGISALNKEKKQSNL